MKIIIKIAIALIAVIVICLVGKYGALPLIEHALRQSEVAECMKLERQSREYPKDLFYLTEMQSDMCDRHGFTIDARIQ
jgi:hypothetical protein